MLVEGFDALGDARGPGGLVPELGRAEQARAVKGAVEEGRAVTVAEVSAAFTGAQQSSIAALLNSLVALGIIRVIEGGRYAA